MRGTGRKRIYNEGNVAIAQKMFYYLPREIMAYS